MLARYQARVDDDEHSFGGGEDLPIRSEDLGGMEELAAFAANVVADDREFHRERDRAQVVDFHVARHGDNVKRPVQFTHRLVEHRGDDASVDVSRWSLVGPCELDRGRRRDRLGIARVDAEMHVESLGIEVSATEAVVS